MARRKRKRGQVPGETRARPLAAREATGRRTVSPALLMVGLLAVVVLLGGLLAAMFRSSLAGSASAAKSVAPVVDTQLPATSPTPTVGQELSAVTDAPGAPLVLQGEQIEAEFEHVQRISVADAKVLVDKGEAVLYDTRRPETFLEGHAASAVSFPESSLEVLLPTLPTDKALIFYCT